MDTLSTVDRNAELGRRLTEITLGLDRLGSRTAREAGNDDYEDLVPIFIGTSLVSPSDLPDWCSARAELDRLAADVDMLEPGARRTFLTEMIRSLRASATYLSGEPIGFVEKVRELVGVPAETVPDEEVDAIHSRLDRLLAARGFSNGTLAERVTAWQTGRYLDPLAIPAEFDRLMATAKERTDRMIWPTGDYTMRLNAVRDVPYAGRCSFADGTMDINLDVLVTRSGLKHLVCHEVFPGHSTQLLSTLAVAKRGESPLDALLCTTNAVTGAVQEGIGDQGIELIDWVEDEDDAAQIEVRRLQTATGTNAAWHLHCSGWTREQSIAYLEDVGFGQRSWATVRTGMALHPFRGIFLASYWFGNETVRALRLAATDETSRTRLLEALFRQVHSVTSLRLAAGAAA